MEIQSIIHDSSTAGRGCRLEELPEESLLWFLFLVLKTRIKIRKHLQNKRSTFKDINAGRWNENHFAFQHELFLWSSTKDDGGFSGGQRGTGLFSLCHYVFSGFRAIEDLTTTFSSRWFELGSDSLGKLESDFRKQRDFSTWVCAERTTPFVHT